MKKIFVGSVSFSVTEDTLRSLFEKYGTVGRIDILTDPVSGFRRGYAFVQMVDDTAAVNAISDLNGMELEGRTLSINEARPKVVRLRGWRSRYLDGRW